MSGAAAGGGAESGAAAQGALGAAGARGFGSQRGSAARRASARLCFQNESLCSATARCAQTSPSVAYPDQPVTQRRFAVTKPTMGSTAASGTPAERMASTRGSLSSASSARPTASAEMRERTDPEGSTCEMSARQFGQCRRPESMKISFSCASAAAWAAGRLVNHSSVPRSSNSGCGPATACEGSAAAAERSAKAAKAARRRDMGRGLPAVFGSHRAGSGDGVRAREAARRASPGKPAAHRPSVTAP